jgi:DNA-binding transcriptional LysR family regulator
LALDLRIGGGAKSEGRIRIAATQDFADHALPRVLRQFAKTHPRVRLDLRIGRSVELIEALEKSEADLCIVMREEPAADEIGIIREPMLWLAASEGLEDVGRELPLALLDPPCGFRNAALAALNKAGRPYRIAATSQSLAGLRTAIRAGLAVTLRTARWIGPGIKPSDDSLKLPEAGQAEFSIRIRAEAPRAVHDLGRMMQSELALPEHR